MEGLWGPGGWRARAVFGGRRGEDVVCLDGLRGPSEETGRPRPPPPTCPPKRVTWPLSGAWPLAARFTSSHGGGGGGSFPRGGLGGGGVGWDRHGRPKHPPQARALPRRPALHASPSREHPRNHATPPKTASTHPKNHPAKRSTCAPAPPHPKPTHHPPSRAKEEDALKLGAKAGTGGRAWARGARAGVGGMGGLGGACHSPNRSQPPPDQPPLASPTPSTPDQPPPTHPPTQMAVP